MRLLPGVNTKVKTDAIRRFSRTMITMWAGSVECGDDMGRFAERAKRVAHMWLHTMLHLEGIKVCFVQCSTLIVLPSDLCLISNPPDGHVKTHQHRRDGIFARGIQPDIPNQAPLACDEPSEPSEPPECDEQRQANKQTRKRHAYERIPGKPRSVPRTSSNRLTIPSFSRSHFE